jgi:hypothetical protein
MIFVGMKKMLSSQSKFQAVICSAPQIAPLPQTLLPTPQTGCETWGEARIRIAKRSDFKKAIDRRR